MPTPRLALPYIVQGQAQKEVTHNDALVRLDALVDLYILDRDLGAPPGSPSDGDAYIVAASPTGAWAGQAGNIAYLIDGAWRFYVPVNRLTSDQDVSASRLRAWRRALPFFASSSRGARRMSLITFSADGLSLPAFCLIFAP